MSEIKTTAFIIGDPHFKAKNLYEVHDFIERTLEIAAQKKPTFIVILGDTLDTHEVVRVQPHNLACEFIDGLSEIAPVYLIIGNHDLINQCQFLTDNHIFNPLKKWPGVTVVDKPIYATYNDFSFVFCPYVEPGKFVTALNTVIEDGETWELVDCIFAHQEFKGCKMGAIVSEIGDKWNEDYPPVISGHIHDSQTIGENIFYPGSPIQHGFGELSNKRIWNVTFGEETPPYFSIEKINLGLKGKKILYLDVDNIDKFDKKLLNKYNIKISLSGTSEQFKLFRQSKIRTELIREGVTIVYAPVNDIVTSGVKRTRKQVSFLEVLKEIVKKKTPPVQEVYKELVTPEELEDSSSNYSEEDDSEETVIYELVFHSDSE